jgi:Zn-dependent protease/CBS domain-containing protein
MGSSFQVGRVMGIAIEIHPSWLVIGFLVTYSLATVQFPLQYSGWGTGTYWLVGAITSVGFLASVLGHELSHAVVARRLGVKISAITLFVFGGAATMEEEPARARDEALIAAAGPVSSLLIGAALWTIDVLVQGQEQVAALVGWLGFINLTLGVFNLVPGFPMDGGRILRAALWRIRGDRYKATRNAATVGQLIGYGLIAFGILLAFQPGAIVAGIWLALIGWFLSSTAEQAAAQTGIERTLRGVRVRDIMEPEPPSISPNESVATLVHDRMLHGENRTFLVRYLDGGLAGIVTLSDVRRVPRDDWEAARVTDVMTRYGDLATVTPDDDVQSAMRLIQERGVSQLPVITEGRTVAGLLTRAGIMRLIETRLRLGM